MSTRVFPFTFPPTRNAKQENSAGAIESHERFQNTKLYSRFSSQFIYRRRLSPCATSKGLCLVPAMCFLSRLMLLGGGRGVGSSRGWQPQRFVYIFSFCFSKTHDKPNSPKLRRESKPRESLRTESVITHSLLPEMKEFSVFAPNRLLSMRAILIFGFYVLLSSTTFTRMKALLNGNTRKKKRDCKRCCFHSM